MTTMPAMQTKIGAVFMRGGTSKAIVFHAKDLPELEQERHWIYTRAIGSPDPGRRQLDGLGGGVSSLSKVCVIGPSTRDDADIDFTFVQIPVDGAEPDYSANCGNMSSAVGPFAVEEGLVSVEDGEAVVRIHNTNTHKIIESRFEVRGGFPVVEGTFVNPGVAGSGARIRLDFLDPGGAATGRLLPSGKVMDRLDDPSLRTPVNVSLIDATNAVVFVHSENLGVSGYETPDELEACQDVMAQLEAIRRVASMRMGLSADTAAAGRMAGSPKVALVAPPRSYRMTSGEMVQAEAYDISIRIISMGQAHRAVTLTGAMCAAVAAELDGSAVAIVRRKAGAEGLRIGHASGIIPAMARVNRTLGDWHAERASVFRTARRLMEGHVLVPQMRKGPCPHGE